MKTPPLSQEVIDRSTVAPDGCVMSRYDDGMWGWRLNRALFRVFQARREAQRALEAGAQRAREAQQALEAAARRT